MLKLEVAIRPPSMDFDFNDARPMPFLSAPSTPKRFGDFSLSAPSSPSRIAEFYRSFDDFDHEDKPGTPTSAKGDDFNDFAFDFRSELEGNSVFAEELFDGGKIRPLKPPTGQYEEDRSPLLSPRSPRSPIAQGKKIIRDVFSPRKKKDIYSDPFATENTRNERGRERVQAFTKNTSRRGARSLSPYRVSEYTWEEEERKLQENSKQQSSATATHNSKATTASTTNKSSSRKWRLKDFLLFRSASEGRASDKHKYQHPSIFKKPEDAKNSISFRSSDSSSGSNSGKRRKAGQVSAHELHYKTNKAASEDLKRKTYLPYKQGILGMIGL